MLNVGNRGVRSAVWFATRPRQSRRQPSSRGTSILRRRAGSWPRRRLGISPLASSSSGDYSIASSAVASKAGDMSIPSAWAVLRFSTISNLVAC